MLIDMPPARANVSAGQCQLGPVSARASANRSDLACGNRAPGRSVPLSPSRPDAAQWAWLCSYRLAISRRRARRLWFKLPPYEIHNDTNCYWFRGALLSFQWRARRRIAIMPVSATFSRRAECWTVCTTLIGPVLSQRFATGLSEEISTWTKFEILFGS